MKIIGITGCLASGKTTLSNILKEKYNIPIFNSDRAAKESYNESYKDLKSTFPSLKQDMSNIKQIINYELDNLKTIESIIHPLVDIKLKEFLKNNQSSKIVALEIPLLFECNYDSLCDIILLLHINKEEQNKRIKKRVNITEKDLDLFNKRLLSIEQKLINDKTIYINLDDFNHNIIKSIF